MTPQQQQRLHTNLLGGTRDGLGADSPSRTRRVIAYDAYGQPRTYRLAPTGSQPAAYRRLALTILGLDVPTLAGQLRSARRPPLARAA